jgi:predicted permease
MTPFFATLTPLLTLFICIAAGFTVYKCKLLPDNAAKVMAVMETWVFCPALSFMTMVRFCTLDSIGEHLINIILATVGVTLSMTVAILLSRAFAKKGSAEQGIYAYGIAFANGGYMGDPVVLALFGDVVLAYYKLFYLPFSLLINSWGISVMTPASEGKNSFWKRLINAPTIAMLAGVAVRLSGLGNYLPTPVTNALDTLKVCMGPVAMLLAGVTIAKYDLLSMLKKKKVYVASALRLTLLPALTVLFIFGAKTLANVVLGTAIDNDILFLIFFATAMPIGLNTIIFPEAFGGEPETGASMAMISHTLCVVSIPLMYALMIAVFGVPFI